MFKYKFKINFRLVYWLLSGSRMPLKGVLPSQSSSLFIKERGLLTQLQVVSSSLVCLLNVSGGLLRMLRTHFRALSSLTFIRGNGPPACCEYGGRQKNAITEQ